MASSNNDPTADHADRGFDNYGERVLRNEGELVGLRDLVRETRSADRELVNQRADSLAAELERRAESLVTLAEHQRIADLREFRDALRFHIEHADERWVSDQKALRLAVETVTALFTEITNALEQRRIAATDELRQKVIAWRDSDREARVLQAAEYERRLDALNHAHEKQEEHDRRSVTQELFNAEMEAQHDREARFTAQLNSLDRAILLGASQGALDKVRDEILQRLDTTTNNALETVDIRIGVLTEKVNEVRAVTDTSAGKSVGLSQFAGYAIAGVSLFLTVITIAVVLILGLNN